MATLNLTIKKKTGKIIAVEIDAERLERLAANFGFFSKAFLASVSRAEEDVRKGRVRHITSLKNL